MNGSYDVVVIGGGNAALVAAMTASRLVPRVCLVERAPQSMRGGNTRHTRNIRHAHDANDGAVVGVYDDEELWQDLVRVSGADLNEGLARLMIAQSRSCPPFMEAHGVRWQPPLRGTLHLSRTNRFFLGGGKALLNAYYQTARGMGIAVLYDSRAVELHLTGDTCTGVVVERAGQIEVIGAKAVVVASGGFEANLDWLAENWGDAAHNFMIRGGPFNDGTMLRHLLDLGACPIGDPKGFHAVAVDARGPRSDGGIVTRLDSIPFGIAVNQAGVRFADEGEDLWPRRYASWGRLIAEQPGQAAYSIFDARTRGQFIPGVYPAVASTSIRELAEQLGLPPERLETTLAVFNSAAPAEGSADFSRLDGRRTQGIAPPKSNWAQRVDTPPFYAYPLRPGITFTYLGVEVNRESRIIRGDGGAFPNVFAAGEIMAGNILTKGYLAGIGLTIGTVFGRIAGDSAARTAAQ